MPEKRIGFTFTNVYSHNVSRQVVIMMVMLSATKTAKIVMDSYLQSTLMTMGVSKLNIFEDFNVIALNQ